jgi:hypothetical protein
MGVGRMVGDCMVDNFVDIVVDSKVEVPEAFEVGSLGYVGVAFGVQH